MPALLAGILAFGAPTALNAQSYQKLWKSVTQAEQTDKPRTTLGLVDQILRKAQTEKNEVQWLRASLVRLKLCQSISTDSFRVERERLATRVPQLTDTAVVSIGHAMLAHLYATARHDSASLSAARQHARLALTPFDLLYRTKAKPYADLLEPADDDRSYGPSLLPAVAQTVMVSLRHIGDHQQARHISHRLAQYFAQHGQRGAALLVRLDSIQNDNTRSTRTRDLLRQWTQDYRDVPENVETYLALAQCTPTADLPALTDTLRSAIARYRHNPRVKVLTNLLREYENPEFSWSIQETLYPRQDYRLPVTGRNVRRVTLRFYPISLNAAQAYGLSTEQLKKHRADRPVLEASVDFAPEAPACLSQQRTCTFRVPDPGLYYVETTDGHIVSACQLVVSQLFAISIADGKQHRVSIVDGQSGHLVPDATLKQYEERNGQMVWIKDLSPDADGCFRTPQDTTRRYSYRYFATTPHDQALPPLTLYTSYLRTSATDSVNYTQLFTDRAVYRPGQTVRYSGVGYKRVGDRFAVVPNRLLTVRIYNVQHQLLHTDSLTTDAMGHVEGRFTLPETGLNGIYRIEVPGATTSFRVEAYKRPTFQVELLPVTTTYRTGDTLQVCGRVMSFTQQPVTSARVDFNLTRSTQLWLAYGNGGADGTSIQQGTTLTDAQGRFSLSLILQPDSNLTDTPTNLWRRRICYQLQTTVTAPQGESQSAQASYYTAARPAIVSAAWPELLDAAHPQNVTVSVLNPSGENIAGEGRYTFTDQRGTCYPGGTFTSGRSFRIQFPDHMPSGRYAVTTTVSIAESDTALWRTDTLCLFREEDKRVPDPRQKLFFLSRPNATGDSTEIFIGSPLPDAHLFVDILSGGRIVDSRTIPLNNTVMKLPFYYKPSYGNGARLVVAMVSHNRLYTNSALIEKPRPDKRLQLSWSTFRSRLQPGQRETWTLRINRPDGRVVPAVLTAALTDASLRQWGENHWSYNTYISRYVPYFSWQSQPQPYTWAMANAKLRLVATPNAPALPALDTSLPGYELRLRGYGRPLMMAASSRMAIKSTPEVATDAISQQLSNAMPGINSKKAVLEEVTVTDNASAGGNPTPAAPNYLRTDFSETAFFAPSLLTNSKGEVDIAFTLPQSLTSWRFQAIAHDEWMDWGILDTVVVAQKDFTLQPNLPRFVRQGDKTTLTALLRNTTDRKQQGTATLLLTDAKSGAVISQKKQKFTLQSDTTATLSFDVTTGQGPLMICRLTAEGKNFADGEEHYLPVLADRETAITATPFSLQQAADSTIILPTETGTPDNLTVEVAGNALWYALEALPGLTQPRQPDAVSMADACYATSLAAYLVKRYPALHTYFRTLADTGSTDRSVSDLLRRNPDLRQILTAETPWADDAEQQAERLSQLATLTDTTTLTLQLASWRDKMADLQRPDGSWGWFAGMEGNLVTTLDILTRAARLQRMTGMTMLPAQSIERASLWTDRYMEQALSRLNREALQSLTPSRTQLLYLYTQSLLGRTGSQAFSTLLKRVEATANGPQPIDRKALMACILELNRRPATTLLQSLEELTVCTPEMGRYFDSRRAPLSLESYRIGTQTATIEAFSLQAEKYAGVIRQMQQWLIQSRRTQGWTQGTTAAEAVYALLLHTDSTARLTAGQRVRFALTYQGRTVARSADSVAASPMLGYVRQDFGPLKADRLTVSTTTAQPVWGAVYVQHTRPVNETQPDGSQLTAERRLEIWRQGQWQPAKGVTLHVGDEVRQVVSLTATRDFDFVSLNLPRPACFEPKAFTSGYASLGSLAGYRAIGDTQTRYFVDRLPKGTYTLIETYTVSRSGQYQIPRAGVSCAYAPEFAGHSAPQQVEVD